MPKALMGCEVLRTRAAMGWEGIPQTDARQLLSWGAIGSDDQIDFLERRPNCSPSSSSWWRAAAYSAAVSAFPMLSRFRSRGP